jgi:hypothetical protein
MAEESVWQTLIQKLPVLYHIIVTIFGVVIVLLAAVGQFKYGGFVIVPIDAPWRVALGIFGIALVLSGFYFRRDNAAVGNNIPKAEDHAVQIVSPIQNAKVKMTDVRGTIQKMPPDGYNLWIFRVYSDGRYYPLRECSINEKEKTWDAFDCDPGGNQGEFKSLAAYIVGPDGQALIHYNQEAVQRFKPIRDQLEAATQKPVASLPSILKRTKDTVPCASVRVEKA